MKKTLLCIVSVLFVAYLATMAIIATTNTDNRLCTGVQVTINDTVSQNFVTVGTLAQELGTLPQNARYIPLNSINIDSIERILCSIDKIEHASVFRLTNGKIHIEVEPMRPVARVFDGNRSYYINKDGKQIGADARYFVDVPIIQGYFPDTTFSAKDLLPLVEYLNRHPEWDGQVSAIKVDSPSDILIIPTIKGLVINLGTPDDFADKFSRIDLMFHNVLRHVGWNRYDTISVKWKGQVVGSKRQNSNIPTITDDGISEEEVDIETMLAGDNIAPGQSIPGEKAKSDTPIPASVRRHEKTDSATTTTTN